MNIMEIKGVRYSYDNKRNVLKGVSAELDAGKMYAILGPSGCGKTTLLSLLGGLDSPLEGQILFEGQDIDTVGLATHRKNNVAFIFQSYNLIDYLTPKENVALTSKLPPQPILERVGLTEEESDRIIARLLEERFIDESRFARYFVNDKLRFNKWGRIKIAYELQKRNIPAPIRSEALEGIDEKEYADILQSLLKAKKKSTKGKDERDIYIKLLRFAASRGFESREASRCLKQLFNGNDYEEDF